MGFQMVWLAEGLELTLQQLILSYLKPQGALEGNAYLKQDERQRTGERERERLGGWGRIA